MMPPLRKNVVLYEAPELELEPIEVLSSTFFPPVVRPALAGREVNWALIQLKPPPRDQKLHLGGILCGKGNAGFVEKPGQVNCRRDPKFSSDSAAMNLDCLYSRTQFGGNLFIQQASNNQLQNFELTRR